jgi:hypothetical protein
LGSKCHFKCTVMIASEDKFRTTVWLNFADELQDTINQLEFFNFSFKFSTDKDN